MSKIDRTSPVDSIKHDVKRTAISDNAHHGEEQKAIINYQLSPVTLSTTAGYSLIHLFTLDICILQFSWSRNFILYII